MEFKLEIVNIKMNEIIIKELFHVLEERKKYNDESYTSYLINNHEFLAKKIGEETSELIIDFIKKNKQGIIKNLQI